MVKSALFLLAILYVLVAAIFCMVQDYRLDRDIDSLIDRAQVAADREDMLEYMVQLKVNMEKWGMVRGHTALIFKNPRNDMALHYRAVQRIIGRLDSIKELPKSETAYQVALDDLRGTIRELPNLSGDWIWVKYGWWVVLVGVALWAAVLASLRFS